MQDALSYKMEDQAGYRLLAGLNRAQSLVHLDLARTAVVPLAGDASARRYWRVQPKAQSNWLEGGSAVLMAVPLDHPEEALAPFLAVGSHLQALGLSVPRVYHADIHQGIALLEDLGDTSFAHALAQGAQAPTLYQAALDVLASVHEKQCPERLPITLPQQEDCGWYTLPVFSHARLQAEVERFLDWYMPLVRGQPATADERATFAAAWHPLLQEMLQAPLVLTQFDYHSPNLHWLPQRAGIAQVGVLDFQDAVRGLAAYDVVSLAQDARRDIEPDLETSLMQRYCALRCLDRQVFERHYAIAGAQRATRILGTFARLHQRDGKPHYLQHQPRMWRYLEHNLAHPDLAGLEAWFAHCVPLEQRWLDWERFAP
jgi:N-acetylmuramate 1-kinase